jgi:hypothetical protein
MPAVQTNHRIFFICRCSRCKGSKYARAEWVLIDAWFALSGTPIARRRGCRDAAIHAIAVFAPLIMIATVTSPAFVPACA